MQSEIFGFSSLPRFLGVANGNHDFYRFSGFKFRKFPRSNFTFPNLVGFGKHILFPISDIFSQIRGRDGDEEIGEQASKIPNFAMKEAINNLPLFKAKVTRIRRDERKSLLQTYQRVQGLSLSLLSTRIRR
jgi:hypothetical protein